MVSSQKSVCYGDIISCMKWLLCDYEAIDIQGTVEQVCEVSNHVGNCMQCGCLLYVENFNIPITGFLGRLQIIVYGMKKVKTQFSAMWRNEDSTFLKISTYEVWRINVSQKMRKCEDLMRRLYSWVWRSKTQLCLVRPPECD